MEDIEIAVWFVVEKKMEKVVYFVSNKKPKHYKRAMKQLGDPVRQEKVISRQLFPELHPLKQKTQLRF